jgi:hypothetical protein
MQKNVQQIIDTAIHLQSARACYTNFQSCGFHTVHHAGQRSAGDEITDKSDRIYDDDDDDQMTSETTDGNRGLMWCGKDERC